MSSSANALYQKEKGVDLSPALGGFQKYSNHSVQTDLETCLLVGQPAVHWVGGEDLGVGEVGEGTEEAVGEVQLADTTLNRKLVPGEAVDAQLDQSVAQPLVYQQAQKLGIGECQAGLVSYVVGLA
mmetsp:Transcript_75476/g.202209  ORF Transcript_75476/g.202209 Transcript_75476/m.202209 type:complete len:126 (-) Transcript_75476:70-447(-)